ncbi:MAG: hypothetical protein ACT4QF_17655, partial [Sporichthyaceae bacterium]
MVSLRPLPPDLATTTSLPDLAALVIGVEPGSTCGYDTVEMLRAAQRLRNVAASVRYAWAVEVAV